MSHHFDTPTAQKDPRINICDFYLFEGRPQTVVMALTVNPDAGISGPDTFHEEGLYAFRFDLDKDAREDVSFKVRFGTVTHAGGHDHGHEQTVEVLLCTGHAARHGIDGKVVAKGRTGEIVMGEGGVHIYAGLAPDIFAGDSAALGAFRTALFKENRFDPAAFQNRQNFFARRNVTAIVLEVPCHMIGHGTVHAWATASLYGHAPEVQVSRWGLPLITNIFMPDLDMREAFNRATPSGDAEDFGGQIGAVAEKLAGLAGSAAPADHAKQLVARLCPVTLPYVLDTPAVFDAGGFNGRALADDVMDVILTLAANTALGDGIAPDKTRIRGDFPYFGPAYSKQEQVGVVPVRPVPKQ
ncbi:MAG TPA: DUF4331 family protein [Stellaceae bacterium]|jgi:hypothetical protein|nr:DUF4331 family protein [Stellaceae bacterium]